MGRALNKFTPIIFKDYSRYDKIIKSKYHINHFFRFTDNGQGGDISVGISSMYFFISYIYLLVFLIKAKLKDHFISSNSRMVLPIWIERFYCYLLI